jgi:hypothetical protein
MIEIIREVITNSLMITCFVVVIMLFIELINVLTQGSWSKWLGKNKLLQVVVASVLGLIPGCFGGFAAVGMWTHGVISFGALTAAMISSVGDEAFVMMVQMPQTALLIFGIVFVLAIGVGILIDSMNCCVRRPNNMEHHLVVHQHEHLTINHLFKKKKAHFRNFSFARVLLLSGLGLFILGMLFGVFEHHSSDAHPHEAADSIGNLLDESWFNGIFTVMASIMFLVFLFVDEHFLEEHLWKHIIRQHVPKILFWTLLALTLIHFLAHSVEMTNWMSHNPLWVLLFAVLVGFIPESGPHMVFITLFLGGQIPFSILLANSITQDGHSSLPLLAESKLGFVSVKLINGALGLAVGLIGYLSGF